MAQKRRNPTMKREDFLAMTRAQRDGTPLPRTKPGQVHEDQLGLALAAAGITIFDFKVWLAHLEAAAAREAPVDLNTCVRQYPWGLRIDRKFRSDFAFPLKMLLVEVIGGAHAAGRAKVKRDTERDGLAAAAGYRIVKVTTEQVRDGTALGIVRRAVEARDGG